MTKTIVRNIAVALALTVAGLAPAGAYDGAAVSGGGTISGVVKYKGAAPAPVPLDVNKDKEVCALSPKMSKELAVGADGGIQYAVVSIATIAKGKPFEATKAVIDQKGCDYLPHITFTPAGKEFDVTNDDGILHNIHTYSTKNPVLNRAQPKFKKTLTEKLEQPERVKLTCDVHGWMTGWLVVMDHPYYAATDEKGMFKLTDVPPGDYELKVWQEKLGETTQKVTVQGGQETKVTFELAGK